MIAMLGFHAPAPRQPLPAAAAAAAAVQGMPPGRHPPMPGAQNPRGSFTGPRGPGPHFAPAQYAAAGQPPMPAAGPMAFNAQSYGPGFDRGGRGGAGGYPQYPPGAGAPGGYGAYGTAGGHQASGGRGPSTRPPSNAAYPARADQPGWAHQRR